MNYGFFVRRPVLAAVISILITITGIICLRVLPVALYPDLLPPEVSISAHYPGADAKTVSQAVAIPLEQQIDGVEGMLYMKSTSNAQGILTITITFRQGIDPNQALVDTNNRVQRVLSKLPQAVQQMGVRVEKRSSSILGIVAMKSTSSVYDRLSLGNYALLNVVDDLKRLPGIGDVQILGGIDYSVRIWFRPDVLSHYQLIPEDIISAVREQNAQYAIGRFGDAPDTVPGAYTYSATLQGPLDSVEKFSNVLLRSDANGATLRLKDVARIELGAQQYMVESRLNGNPMVPIMIFLQPKANALATMRNVKKRMEELQRAFPEGIEYAVSHDTTQFIEISIREVAKTLAEATVLVILIVFVFLQNWRATLIPIVTIPISVIGTFSGMYVLGFSINMLTLFGLVLAIGIVVDDAIIVLENVERLMIDEKLSPHTAAVKSMSEVAGPVIAIVLVLCAVFIPISFVEGMIGIMYQQFAVTIAISVIISGIVALTLTPALCSLLLKPDHTKRMARSFSLFNRFFSYLSDCYMRSVQFFLYHTSVGIFAFIIVCFTAFYLFEKVPRSLVPQEDQGVMLAFVMLPAAASLERTTAVVDQVEKVFLKNSFIKDVTSITGYDIMSGGLKTNAASIFLSLTDWRNRRSPSEDSRNLINSLIKQTNGIKDGFILPVNPPAIIGLSTSGGFDLYLQDRGDGSWESLYDITQKLIFAANQRVELAQVRTSFDPDVPQYSLKVDHEKAYSMGVPITMIYNTLAATLGNIYINDITLYGRNYQVKLQSEENFRRIPEDLKQLFVRSNIGTMIPLSVFVSATRIVGSDQIERFNAFPSIRISGSSAAGYTSGDAIQILQKLADQILPENYQIAWTGSAYQEINSAGQGYIAMFFGILMVFLILAAQYECWSLPFAVIATVPFAVTGALSFTWLRNLENDVYFQIGLLTLVGLAAKNAILIVEFAVLERKSGKSIIEAALSAARLRFRPIVMTSLAFIFGTLPLAVSSGAGDGSRHSIGTGVIGGMLAATCIATLFIPLFYSIVANKEKN